MMQVPTSGAAPEMAAPEQEAAPSAGSGYVIEIHCNADGQAFKVGVEPAAEEDSEESAGAGGAPDDDSGDLQTVATIGEVCKLVREIVAHAGQMADTDASVQEMGSGYGSNT